MMAVSCTKAMLVVLFFMHVLWEANWKYVLTIPAAMMAIFLGIMLVPDIGLRNRMVSQERALHMARGSDLKLLEQAAESKLLDDQAHYGTRGFHGPFVHGAVSGGDAAGRCRLPEAGGSARGNPGSLDARARAGR